MRFSKRSCCFLAMLGSTDIQLSIYDKSDWLLPTSDHRTQLVILASAQWLECAGDSISGFGSAFQKDWSSLDGGVVVSGSGRHSRMLEAKIDSLQQDIDLNL